MAKWTLSTRDTVIGIEIKNGQPCIVFLGQPGGKNFAGRPACARLPRRYTVNQAQITTQWEFRRAEEGELAGGKYTELYFRDPIGGLEARSRWEAHDDNSSGAVTHQIRLDNKTGQPVIIYQPESLDITLGVNDPTEVFFAHKNNADDYLEPLCDRYFIDVWTKPDEDAGFIPFVTLRAAKSYGLYIGLVSDHGRIAVRGIESGGIITAKIKAGLYDDFCTTVNPDESFEVPMAFIGAYSEDIGEVSNRLRRYLNFFN